MYNHPEVMENGKSNLNISRVPMNTKNYLESTERHLSSSEQYFPKTHYSADSPRESGKNDNANALLQI